MKKFNKYLQGKIGNDGKKVEEVKMEEEEKEGCEKEK